VIAGNSSANTLQQPPEEALWRNHRVPIAWDKYSIINKLIFNLALNYPKKENFISKFTNK